MMLILGDLVQTGQELVVLTGQQIPDFAEILGQTPMTDDVAREQIIATVRTADRIVGYRVRSRNEDHPGIWLGQFCGRKWYAQKERAIAPRDSWPGDRLTSPMQREFRTRIGMDAARYAADLKAGGGNPERAQEIFIEHLTVAIETYDVARTQLIDSLRQQLTAALNRMPRPTMAIWPHAAGDSLEGRAPIFPEGSFYYGDGGIPVPIGPDFVAGPRFDPVPERDEAAQAALDHLESDGA